MSSKLLVVAEVVLLVGGAVATATVYWVNPSDFRSNFEAISWILAALIGLAAVSFGLSRTRIRQRYARIVAVAFFIIGTAVPVTFAAANACWLPCEATGTSPGWYVSGGIVAPFGNGTGTLTVGVYDDNTSTISITGVTFSSQAPGNGTTISNAANLVLMNHDKPVNPQNTVQPGENATGSIKVSNVTAGTTYQMTAYIAFSKGGEEVATLSFTAQA